MAAVGIDISSNKINLVELSKSRKGTLIKNAADFEIAPEAIKKGELLDPVALSKRLKETWRNNKFSGRNIFIGLSNLKAMVREVELPLVKKEEIDSSLKYQINDFIPIPKDNIFYDYYITEQTESSSRLMLAGAMKSMVTNVIEAVKAAGLIAQAIDLNCFSLFRAIDEVYNLSKNKETICAVHIGKDISIIEIIQNDDLKFPRFLTNSLSTFVDNIEKSTGVDENIAGDSINHFDFQSIMEGNNPKKAADKEIKKDEDKKDKEEQTQIPDDDIKRSITSTADSFIAEIKMSIEHFLQEDPKAKIGKILVSGENLGNFEKYIQYKTDYKVENLNISDAFSVEIVNKVNDVSQILNPLAIGMALRGIKQ